MSGSSGRRVVLAVRCGHVLSVPGVQTARDVVRLPRQHDRLRVLVVTESFLPQVNGVTNSVRRVLEHLQLRGHDAMLVAPSGPGEYAGAPVRRVRSLALPTYREFPVGIARAHTLRRVMADFAPDVVHLASPAALGHRAGQAARAQGVPVVAVYQTDLVGFAARYPFPGASALMRRLTRMVHQPADLTLVPSSASRGQLEELGIDRLATWARGVDTELFHPRRRSGQLRAEVGAQPHQAVVGYVGRLAAEKELELLAPLAAHPDIRLVLVGGGPEEQRLRRALPGAHFLGVRHGEELGRTVASLDVFVHTGRTETFCQAAQEALASGVPVVAPDAGGPVDLVRHGRNGFRYPTGDAAALASYVRALVVDQELRAALAAQAFLGVQDRSWAAIGDQLLEHYRGLVRPPAQTVRRTA